ncbi:hypothetical protein BELL_0146g00050 [Botrytis elliptica]|uniref:Uncharacterized protein n=1 Tax=Botrytis elliptica TaxID=278938 RepID=A0A4Z1JTJ3_9HELO|nr:hypothetical protein BELL_0146g00050 [Botrytis elliptica]
MSFSWIFEKGRRGKYKTEKERGLDCRYPNAIQSTLPDRPISPIMKVMPHSLGAVLGYVVLVCKRHNHRPASSTSNYILSGDMTIAFGAFAHTRCHDEDILGFCIDTVDSPRAQGRRFAAGPNGQMVG